MSVPVTAAKKTAKKTAVGNASIEVAGEIGDVPRELGNVDEHGVFDELWNIGDNAEQGFICCSRCLEVLVLVLVFVFVRCLMHLEQGLGNIDTEFFRVLGVAVDEVFSLVEKVGVGNCTDACKGNSENKNAVDEEQNLVMTAVKEFVDQIFFFFMFVRSIILVIIGTRPPRKDGTNQDDDENERQHDDQSGKDVSKNLHGASVR